MFLNIFNSDLIDLNSVKRASKVNLIADTERPYRIELSIENCDDTFIGFKNPDQRDAAFDAILESTKIRYPHNILIIREDGELLSDID